jgi:hypothetical protein
MGLEGFLAAALAEPVEVLQLSPLIQFQSNGGSLLPGQLINVAPPFCVKHDGAYSFRAIPATDRIAFLATLAAEIRDLPDGTKVQIAPPRGAE